MNSRSINLILKGLNTLKETQSKMLPALSATSEVLKEMLKKLYLPEDINIGLKDIDKDQLELLLKMLSRERSNQINTYPSIWPLG